MQWLSVSAHEALGDAIDSSHEQVLTHLEGARGSRVFWRAGSLDSQYETQCVFYSSLTTSDREEEPSCKIP